MGGGSGVRELAERARAAARVLAPVSIEQRNAALLAIAEALDEHHETILAANAEDVHLADALVATGDLSAANRARLALTPAKLEEMSAQVRAVRDQPDPLGVTLDAMELDEGLELEKRSVPLGVLAVIFEARPDAVTQISALALKSGNAVILKPGREVERTAALLVQLIRTAVLRVSLPEEAVSLVLGREAVAELLTMSSLVDLVIPRGSRALVEHIQATTRIPVLGHADGICHIYVDRAVDAAQAMAVIADAKTDYPAVCNAVETVLVHAAVAEAFLPAMVARCLAEGVVLMGDAEVREVLPETLRADIREVEDWHTEYGDLTMAVRVVPSFEAAVAHIHQYGSAHTESICTTDAEAAERFLREVDAASVMVNASTRFADGFRYGLGAEVGVSTSRIHARGPVGLAGLTTTKYLVRGRGHVAGAYRGVGARHFTHRRHRAGEPC